MCENNEEVNYKEKIRNILERSQNYKILNKEDWEKR